MGEIRNPPRRRTIVNSVAQSLIKLIELNKNPIYIYIYTGIIKERKKRIHEIPKSPKRLATVIWRRPNEKSYVSLSNGCEDSFRTFLQPLLYFSFNENSINERSRLYFVGVDGVEEEEEDGRSREARTRERERGKERSIGKRSEIRMHAWEGEERRTAATIAAYRLSENCASTRTNRVKLFAVCGQAEAGLSRIFPLPCGSRLGAAGCAFNTGRIWPGVEAGGRNITRYVSSSYFLLPPIFSILFKQDKLLPLYCYLPFLLPFSKFLFTFSSLS